MSRGSKLIIYFSVIAVFIICLVFYEANKSSKNPIRTVITVNKDTGQTIISDPGQGPQTYGSSNYVIILGANKLMPAGMTEDQFNLAENLITSYVNSQLKRQFTQVSILNSGFTNTSASLSGKLRLGDSQTVLNLSILYPNFMNVEVKISSSTDNPYYSYDSGIQTVQ